MDESYREIVLSTPGDSDNYNFLDFLQIFLLGDTTPISNLLESHASSDLDPVKARMLQHTLRRMPLLTAVPLVLTSVLVISSLAKLVLPLLGTVARSKRSKGRKKRSDDGLEVEDVLTDLGLKLFSGIEQLDLNPTGQEGERHQEGTASGLTKIASSSSVWKPVLENVADLLPILGACVGNVIGCHVRMSYWHTWCKPFGAIISCGNLLGTAIKNSVADVADVGSS
jgi:hypothetical protein